jgi:hypothetical protein
MLENWNRKKKEVCRNKTLPVVRTDWRLSVCDQVRRASTLFVAAETQQTDIPAAMTSSVM